ncbi:MAG: RsmE family RNA methyltransferase [Candidatus Gracilibacteria bacterium]|nr:RsmE family RNA methyltransferase [Candidatus Gracilibacteria bacterium]
MQRFFFSHLPLGKDITISEDSFVHQVSRVLRATIGENITLFNGDGQEYIYTIRTITKKEIGLSFQESHQGIQDSTKIIRLYQALPNKYEKIEYILQKGIEVGVQEFVFFRSERSQRLAIHSHKIERFNEIAREATEQCFGNIVPAILFSEEKMPTPKDGYSYVFHTKGEGSKHLRDINTEKNPLNIFVGPEGGWSPGEITAFKERNIQLIHLGERILRTETTGLVTAFFIIQR